jgi:hypothetical protein
VFGLLTASIQSAIPILNEVTLASDDSYAANLQYSQQRPDRDPVKFAGNVSDMRRRNHVILLSQRVILRKRLNVKNVYCCAGDLSATYGIDKCGFVNDRSSRSIHKASGRFHEAELVLTHQASRPIAHDEMNRQKIGLSK